MNAFGELHVRLDPWQVEYGAEVPAAVAAGEEESSAKLVLDVELAAGEWKPIVPNAGGASPAILFVDGVRRVEARVVIRTERGFARGAFGSYAVGAVKSDGETAEFVTSRVERILALGSGLSLDRAVRVGPLTYVPISTESEEDDGPIHRVHVSMRQAEERLGRDLASGKSLVLLDGPLTFEDRTRADTVGYVKSIQRLYLDGKELDLLRGLPPGSRTPVFFLNGAGRFARYSWFVRLEEPRRGDSELSGLVRMEVAETVGRDRAIGLADSCTRVVPAYRARRGLDPRAPQNLLPIAALERQLRRELGETELVRRLIEETVAREALEVGHG